MRWILILLILIPGFSQAQDGQYGLGARNNALSGASVTLADSWAIFNNPGALGSYEHSTLIASYQNRYNIAGFHVVGGGMVYRQKWFTTGLKYYKFGDELFNQQLAGWSVANRFQMVCLGAGVNVIQTHTEGLSTRRVWTLEMGGTAEITPQILLGAHIFNFKHGELHPTTMKAGLSFRPKDFLMINAEVEKQLQAREQFKAGLEYELIRNVLLRTGINLQGNELDNSQVFGTFGFGLRPKKLLIDYAFTSQTLGAIHEISVGYQLPTQ